MCSWEANHQVLITVMASDVLMVVHCNKSNCVVLLISIYSLIGAFFMFKF